MIETNNNRTDFSYKKASLEMGIVELPRLVEVMEVELAKRKDAE